MPRPTITLSNETPARARIEEALCEDALLVLDTCDLEGADLRRMSFRKARLAGPGLANARLFAGATISSRQAAELVWAMGLNVA